MLWRGGRARFIATVLKTVIPKGIGGSNPSLSANKWKINPDGDGGQTANLFRSCIRMWFDSTVFRLNMGR